MFRRVVVGTAVSIEDFALLRLISDSLLLMLFESAVHIAICSVLDFQNQLQDGPDVVALFPIAHIYVIVLTSSGQIILEFVVALACLVVIVEGG